MSTGGLVQGWRGRGEEVKKGTSGCFHPCRGCTRNSGSHHWSPESGGEPRRGEEGGREGGREKASTVTLGIVVGTEQTPDHLCG